MSGRLPALRASLRLAREALERQLALAQAGVTPEAAAFGEAIAHLDDALKEREAVERAGPFRVLAGGRGRGERR